MIEDLIAGYPKRVLLRDFFIGLIENTHLGEEALPYLY